MNVSYRHSDPSLPGGIINIRFRQWVPNSVQRPSWWGWSPLADAVVPSRRFVLGVAPRQQQGILVLVCIGQVIAMPVYVWCFVYCFIQISLIKVLLC
jgi:hypothetical protein